jgi:hypothetical protein
VDHGDIGANADILPPADVPTQFDALPDGAPSVTYGDVSRYADFNHPQGENQYGFQEDCGLMSSSDVLNQFGIHATENDVVEHAAANGECDVDSSDPSESGATTPAEQAQILSDYQLPAHLETGQSLDSLATTIGQGHGAIVEVNAGYLWQDPNYVQNGQPNHAVSVTGVARDPATGQVQGFYVNDSGDGKSGEFVPAAVMTRAWADAGGNAVVTNSVHPDEHTFHHVHHFHHINEANND